MKQGDYILVRITNRTRMAYGVEKKIHDEILHDDLLGDRSLFATVISVSRRGNPLVRIDPGNYVLHIAKHDFKVSLNGLDPTIPQAIIDYYDPHSPIWANVRERAVQREAEIPEPDSKEPDELDKEASEILIDSLTGGFTNEVTLSATDAESCPEDIEALHTICHSFMHRGASVLVDYPNIYPEIAADSCLSEFRCGWSAEGVDKVLNSSHPSDQEFIAYLDFLVNDDLLGNAWKIESVRDGLMRGFIVDLDCRQEVAMTACTALRLSYEYPERLSLWYHLTQNGVNPRVALVMQAYLKREEWNDSCTFRAYDHGHQVYASVSMRTGDLESLVQGDYDVHNGHPFRNGYSRVNKFWLTSEGTLISQLIAQDGRFGTEEEIEDPFSFRNRKKLIPKEYPRDQMFDMILDFTKENLV